MKFSVALPMVDPRHYLPLAQVAEEVGYDAVAVPESVFFPREVSAKCPYTPDGERFWAAETPFLDPFVVIPAMAALTTRLEFYTNVVKLAIREPLLVAKALSSAAVLSDNRVALGIGLSWIPEEFEWLNQEMRTRGKRTDEAIEIIRRACTGEFVSFDGAHYQFDELMMRPAPTQPVRIYVGGHSEAGLRRAAKLGDGWISALQTHDELAESVRQLNAFRAEYGRADQPFEIKAICSEAYEYDGFRQMEAAGVTDAMVCPWYFYPGDTSTLESQQVGLERFGSEVLRRFR